MSRDLAYFRLEHLRACSGRHLCSPLRLSPPPPDMSSAKRTSLWAEGNSGTSELDLQQSLACSDDALKLLAQQPDAPSLVMREIGGSGGIDVGAFFDDMQSLLLLDCKNSKPATPKGMRDQRIQANRLVLSTMANITPLPPDVRVVLISGWSPHQEDAASAHRSGWRLESGEWRLIPLPERWGVIPFSIPGDPEAWCVIGRWEALSACDWAPTLAQASGEYRVASRDPETVNGLTLREDAPGLLTLRVPADEYGRATRGGANSGPVGALLDRAYAGELDSEDLVFIGETNEKGNIRLCFQASGGGAWGALYRAADSTV